MSNLFIETPLTAPVTNEPVLIEINARMIPIIIRAMKKYKHRKSWVSEDDYKSGLQQINTLEVSLLTGVQEIVTSLERIYRLVDSIHNGTAYSVVAPATATTPAEVAPAIPDAPGAPAGITSGLRRQLLDSQGVLPGGWFGIGSAPATTADLVKAMRNDSQAQIDRVKSSFNALQTLAQGATVFDVVEGFISDGAAITAEGGILATLIVSTMAQSAMMGAQAGQLDDLLAKIDRLITSLDGGATPAPATNVIAEIEKTNVLLG
jgi:hypothetical protein